MSIDKSRELFTYIRFHMFEQACVYLIDYEVFLKGKHRVNSSCYDKHKVEKKLVGSLRKPSAFYTTELVNSYFHLFI
jgi:hypothetical protein